MAGKPPAFEITAVRKDKAEQTFTNYAGKEVTSKYRKIGVLYDNDRGGFNLRFEPNVDDVIASKEEYWLNVQPTRRNRGGDGDSKPPTDDEMPF
jgi:hypothetical protein